MVVNKPRTIMCKWTQSTVLTVKKSKFKGYCIQITARSQIPELLELLYQFDKSLKKATHPHMYAFRIASTCFPNSSDVNHSSNVSKSNKSGKKSLNTSSGDSKCIAKSGSNIKSHLSSSVADQGYYDCGESGAGLRLQGLLDRTKICNVLIVVARWYGGSPLGPQRFRCISDIAAECLRQADYLK